MTRWAVLVVLKNGKLEYAINGRGEIATFAHRRGAKEVRDTFAAGFDEGEVQSVNVVEAPKVYA